MKNKKYLLAEGEQGRTIIARLKPGQDVVACITQILIDKKINGGYMPVFMGGFKRVKLDSMKASSDENAPTDITAEFNEPLEYFGQGTIAEDAGKPSIHIHLSAARTGNKSITGHLVSGEIVNVVEIVIIEVVGITMTRKKDKEVNNLSLLNFEENEK